MGITLVSMKDIDELFDADVYIQGLNQRRLGSKAVTDLISLSTIRNSNVSIVSSAIKTTYT